MNRKKTALIVLSAILAILTAGVATGAIQFSPLPPIFQEFYEGSVSNTSYALESWRIDVVDPDSLSIWLNGTVEVTGEYYFLVSILDGSGFEIVNATRTISLTSGVYSDEQFYCTASDIVSRFTYIDIDIRR